MKVATLQGDNYEHFTLNKRAPKYMTRKALVGERYRPLNSNGEAMAGDFHTRTVMQTQLHTSAVQDRHQLPYLTY